MTGQAVELLLVGVTIVYSAHTEDIRIVREIAPLIVRQAFAQTDERAVFGGAVRRLFALGAFLLFVAWATWPGEPGLQAALDNAWDRELTRRDAHVLIWGVFAYLACAVWAGLLGSARTVAKALAARQA